MRSWLTSGPPQAWGEPGWRAQWLPHCTGPAPGLILPPLKHQNRKIKHVYKDNLKETEPPLKHPSTKINMCAKTVYRKLSHHWNTKGHRFINMCAKRNWATTETPKHKVKDEHVYKDNLKGNWLTQPPLKHQSTNINHVHKDNLKETEPPLKHQSAKINTCTKII